VLELIQESKEDWWEVENLFDLCFAPGREALSSYRLRDDLSPIGELCFLVRDETGAVGGAVRFWEAQISGKAVLLLGPIAVHPTRQGEGLGGYLMHESLSIATKTGWSRAMLVGDASYYSRFGFAKLPDVIMPPPTNSERILGKDLISGAWRGVTGQVARVDP
jgi:predicted N-acetyltransferase YhbS